MKTKAALLVLLLLVVASAASARVTITPEWCAQVRRVADQVMVGRLLRYSQGKVYADTAQDCSMGNQVEVCVAYNSMVFSTITAAFNEEARQWDTAREARGIAAEFASRRYTACMGHLWESAQ